MGSLGPMEIGMILLVVLLLFGAKRIPEIARGLGKGLREFKDATKDVQRELTVDGNNRNTAYRPQPPAQAAPQPQAPPAQQAPAQSAQPAQAAPPAAQAAPDAEVSGPASHAG